MITVVILGAGNVAMQLHTIFATSDSIQVVQGYNRSRSSFLEEHRIPQTQAISKLEKADVYILAVSDNAIEQLSAQLPFKNRFVVHTSGSTPMTQIAKGQRRGVFYPLQTFHGTPTVDFTNLPICLEADNQEDMLLLKVLTNAINAKVYQLSSAQRNILHVAAVFANNFSNLMYIEAKNLCDTNQIPFNILHPLILETAAKIQTTNPIDAQTGPARRNDHKTLTRHHETLINSTQKDLYKLLTEKIQHHYGKEL